MEMLVLFEADVTKRPGGRVGVAEPVCRTVTGTAVGNGDAPREDAGYISSSPRLWCLFHGQPAGRWSTYDD
jgi:hypothetical protein